MIGYTIKHIESSIEKAERGESQISLFNLAIDGMSSPKIRHFINNLCNIPEARYLEIGVYKGANFCSAIYNNKIKACCIDNWIQFSNNCVIHSDRSDQTGKTEDVFYKNVHRCCDAEKAICFKDSEISIIKGDCFSPHVIKEASYMKYNIYFYDGDHNGDSHARMIRDYYHTLDDVFVLIIDDWDFPTQQTLVVNTLAALNIKICKRWDMPGFHNNIKLQMENWWEGLGILLCMKK